MNLAPTRTVAILVAMLYASATVGAQTLLLSDWNTLSSMRTVRSADVDTDGRIWAATSGGVFSYSPITSTAIEYRNINALQSLDSRVVVCDKTRSRVYVGASDGSLDIYSASGTWTNVSDIKRATQYPRRGITSLLLNGSVLYIGTEFGLLSYDVESELFLETIDRIGTIQEKTSVNGISIFRDSLWVATDSGVAAASLYNTSLRPPEVWTVLNYVNGLPRKPINGIASTVDHIYCATDTTIYELVAGNPMRVLGTSYPIFTLTANTDTLYWSSVSGVGTLDGVMQIPWTGEIQGHSTITINGKANILGFIRGEGINIWDNALITTVALNSPTSSKFARMALDNSGSLWVATDIEPPKSGDGVSLFDGRTWTPINLKTNPELGSNSCYRVSALPDGTVLIGTWGRGGVRASITNSTPTLTPYTPATSAVQGISSDSNYYLVADGAMDRQGILWMVNEQAASQLLVNVLQSGSSTGFANCADSRSNHFRTLAIDGANNKWVGSTVGTGLVVWNDKGTADRADDLCNVLRTSNSQIPDNIITALCMDVSGGLWIGTPRGLAVMSAPFSVSNTAIPYVRRINLLGSAIVNDIFVDALNYKWIATTTGVFVLNEDGTQVIAQVTKTTAPLVDENVKCVVINSKTGVAYFGTANGCTTAQTSSIEPAAEYSLHVFPQPYSLTQHSEVVIDGLAADSDVRILTTSGYLVRAMQVRGRQVTWDGLDVNGRQVPPGVYLVQTSSASTKQSSIAKIAVQR